MKKLATILLAITSIMLILVLIGCNKRDSFTKQTYVSSDSKIVGVTIDVRDRDIAISPSSDNQIHVEYFESDKEFYDITVSDDNVLTMKLVNSKIGTDYIGSKPSIDFRKITLKLPNSVLSQLTVTTTNEKIYLSSLVVADSIALSSNGGSIELERVDVGKLLTLSAKNGDIKGTIMGSYDAFSIACTIKKGNCNLPLEKTDGSKSLNVNCNNGDIEIDFIKP